MSKMHELYERGQSVWLDYIDRQLLSSGKLDELIRNGLRGMTSNPSLFEKAIADGHAYRSDLRHLASGNLNAKTIYERLAIVDIQRAADSFKPLYDGSGGGDGYVSLEVSPELAHDTAGTVEEARRLWSQVGRSNVMIKVPATEQGLAAIEQLISEGININVTLLFSLTMYQKVAERYIAGLTRRVAAGNDVRRVSSVASFFVSRVDTAVDALIEERLKNATSAEAPALKGLLGKAALANAKLAYQLYQSIFSGANWKALAGAGARTQRLLWASTGTKNRSYSDVLYVEELIGKDTVNTLPPATLDAFIEHGRIRDSLADDVKGAKDVIDALSTAGISLDDVSRRLLEEGEQSFATAFEKMLDAVDQARMKESPAAARA
ncbi:MAG TPA: transaldolase [Polyangiaceae bacterium]